VIYNLLFLVGVGGPGTSHARGAALQAREGRSMPLVRLPRAKREKSLGPARRRRVGRLHRGLHNGAPHPTSHHGSRWADLVSSSTMVQKAMGHLMWMSPPVPGKQPAFTAPWPPRRPLCGLRATESAKSRVVGPGAARWCRQTRLLLGPAEPCMRRGPRGRRDAGFELGEHASPRRLKPRCVPFVVCPV